MLYLVPTPIGNMEDITLRALRALRECDRVYCEDTRHTGALLRQLDIKKPLVSCHEHNENERAEQLVRELQAGDTIAYASDAGMPGISDPGARLVRACVENGLAYTVLPGPSASLTALVLSGFSAENACFAGFLPREGKPRRERIAALASHPGALIFYESPLRVSATCEELASLLGEREAALCRELSKLHEECVRGTLTELAERYADEAPRGECVLIVAPGGENVDRPEPRELIRELLSRGVSAKDAAKQVSALADLPRNEAYAIALEIMKEGE